MRVFAEVTAGNKNKKLTQSLTASSQRPHGSSCGTGPCRSENAAAFKAGFRFERLGAAYRTRAF